MIVAARAIEIAAWTLGTVMLSLYSGLRHGQERAREESIAAFETTRTQARAGRMKQHPAMFARASTPNQPVDMSTWSAQRIAAYRQNPGATATADAVLRMPRIKLAVPVFSDTSERNLNRGAGWIEGTERIGGPGNVGIAAHRDGFFRALQDVRVGDTLYLEQAAATHIYMVVATHIVEPSDVSVLEQTAVPTITLVTCYPFYFVGSAPKRFIVHAQLVPPSPGTDRKTVP